MTKVGFIGLGAMGLGMALSAYREGFEVAGADINSEAVKKLVAGGGKQARSPKAAATDAKVVVIVVATSDQATTVLFDEVHGALTSVAPNAAILLCITAAPEYVVDLGKRLKRSCRPDVRLIDCPISGGEIRARQGTLSLICSGDGAGFEACQSLLNSFSSHLHWIPGGVGSASGVKIAHQILVGVHILASVEAMGLAFVAGLDLRAVSKSVMSGDGASWLFGQRTAHMIDETAVPASSLAIIAKDLAIVNASGRAKKTPLPLASLALQLFTQTTSAGWDPSDDCNAINVYLSGRGCLEALGDQVGKQSTQTVLNFDMIHHLLIAIHTAAAMEARRLAEALGLDMEILKSFVNEAAGSSAAFKKMFERLDEPVNVRINRNEDMTPVIANLRTAIQAAETLNYPLYLGSAALQELYMF